MTCTANSTAYTLQANSFDLWDTILSANTVYAGKVMRHCGANC